MSDTEEANYNPPTLVEHREVLSSDLTLYISRTAARGWSCRLLSLSEVTRCVGRWAKIELRVGETPLDGAKRTARAMLEQAAERERKQLQATEAAIASIDNPNPQDAPWLTPFAGESVEACEHL